MYVIDVASICNVKCNSKGEPLLEIFEKVVEYLQSVGVQITEIKAFSDSSLKYYIDNKEKYNQYIDREVIIEVAGGIKADKAILAYCLKHDNALFISQDLMREYYKYLPYSSWILERRISVLLVGEEIYLIPMLKAGFPQKQKRVKDEKTAKEKSKDSGKTTLDVLKIIEDSENNSDWNLYD